MAEKNQISIGELAERTGCAVSAVRFYADEGLIPTIRSQAGHRYFNRPTIRRVSFILILQGLGYALSQIRAMLATLPDERTPTKADWDRLSRRIDRDLVVKIEQLEKLRSSLSGCIGCGCLSLKNCALYNPGDKANAQGPGPRYLLGDKAADILG